MASSWKLSFRLGVAGLAASGMLAAGVPLAAAGEGPASGPEAAPAEAMMQAEAASDPGLPAGPAETAGSVAGDETVASDPAAEDPAAEDPAAADPAAADPTAEDLTAGDPTAAADEPAGGLETEDPAEAPDGPESQGGPETADDPQTGAEPQHGDDTDEAGDEDEDQADSPDGTCTTAADGTVDDSCARLVVYPAWIVNGQEVRNGTSFSNVLFDARLALTVLDTSGPEPVASTTPAVWGLFYPLAHDTDVDIVASSSLPDFCGPVQRSNSGYRVQEDGDLQDLSWRDGDTLRIQGPQDYAVTITNAVNCVFPAAPAPTPAPVPTPTTTPTPGPVPTAVQPSASPAPAAAGNVAAGGRANAVVPGAWTGRDNLAATGASNSWMVAAGGILLAAGAGIVVAGRRRGRGL
jgi:LPXTG-motif cell wall-anchored protein